MEDPRRALAEQELASQTSKSSYSGTLVPSNLDDTPASRPTIKDSGIRREFETGAVRDISAGKGRFDLLPPEAITAFAVHMENGCVKYGERNWEKGISLSSFLDSAMRHLFKYLMGMRDEPHLEAAFWNLGCLIATRARIDAGKLPETLDDLPHGRG